jgi:hypothetical protein
MVKVFRKKILYFSLSSHDNYILSPKKIWNVNQYNFFHFVMFQLN